MEFVLAGAYYRSQDAHDFLNDIQKTQKTVTVKLVPDPTNPMDNNAIKVMHDDLHIGFVPSRKTATAKNFSNATLIPSCNQYDTLQPLVKVD
jgi:HIRAN domain